MVLIKRLVGYDFMATFFSTLQVSHLLLSQEGNTVETLFFAADTLHMKISYDFSEFPRDR